MKGFLESLRAAKERGIVPVIPDFKMVSPKDGPLFAGLDPIREAKCMEQNGAPALSVVTEKTEFGGSPELLRQIAGAVGIPVLRKDFIRTADDLRETKACGASAVLFILSCMEQEKVPRLYEEALKLGLEPFVEAHTEEELRFAGCLSAGLTGINNRDILALERDGGTVDTTRRLISAKVPGSFLVSESGIMSAEDVRAAISAGADAVLVGTAVWRSGDPMLFYRSLSRAMHTPKLKICGLCREKDVLYCRELGVDMAGFVAEYPEPVPWNLPAERTEKLISLVKAPMQSCIVTGGGREKVVSLAERLRPDYIQLHHRETLEDTRAIAAALKKRNIGVIKTLPQDSAERRRQFGTEDVSTAMRLLEDAGMCAALIDPRTPDNAAEGGLSADLSFYSLAACGSTLPVVLAGGVKPENIRTIAEKTGADMLDVMTGAESTPGKKDEKKLRLLVQRLRNES